MNRHACAGCDKCSSQSQADRRRAAPWGRLADGRSDQVWRCRVGMAQGHRSHALRVLDYGCNNARIHDRYGGAVHTGTRARTGLAAVGCGRLVTGRGLLVGIARLVMLVAGHLCCGAPYGRSDNGWRRRRRHVAFMDSRHCRRSPIEHQGYGEQQSEHERTGGHQPNFNWLDMRILQRAGFPVAGASALLSPGAGHLCR